MYTCITKKDLVCRCFSVYFAILTNSDMQDIVYNAKYLKYKIITIDEMRKGKSMAIRIITDSAADYSAKEIERRNITCVPLSITFGETTYLGTELEKEAFYELLMGEEEFPTTSQPAPTRFLDCFEEAKEDGDEVIVVVLSGALSGTVQSATLAKSMAEYDKIYIVDSKTATLGMRILVDRAVVMRDKGCTAEEIVKELEELKGRIRIYAGLDTLEYLCKGGRLSRSAANIGTLVNLKPVIMVNQEGAVEVCGKQIGVRHAFKQIIKIVEEDQPDDSYPVYYVYSHDKKNCMGLIQAMQKKGLDFGEPKVRGIGATIGAHVGPGAYGIVYVK